MVEFSVTFFCLSYGVLGIAATVSLARSIYKDWSK